MTRWRCSGGHVWRPLGDGTTLLVELASGAPLLLNATAAEFLTLVRAGASLEEMVAAFGVKYRVDRCTARSDLESIAQALEAHGVLVRREIGDDVPGP
jgi:hypothetical protein